MNQDKLLCKNCDSEDFYVLVEAKNIVSLLWIGVRTTKRVESLDKAQRFWGLWHYINWLVNEVLCKSFVP